MADLGASGAPTYENKGLQRTDPAGSVLGLTENQALTYVATGSTCMDLFFDVAGGHGIDGHERRDEGAQARVDAQGLGHGEGGVFGLEEFYEVKAVSGWAAE